MGLRVHATPPTLSAAWFGFGVQVSGFRVQDSGRRIQGSGFRVQGAEFRDHGFVLGFGIEGLVFRVEEYRGEVVMVHVELPFP